MSLSRVLLRQLAHTRLGSTAGRRSRAAAAAVVARRSVPTTRFISSSAYLSEKKTISSSDFTTHYTGTEPNPAFKPLDTFPRRHFGPDPQAVEKMLSTLGYSDLQEFVKAVVPENILVQRKLKIEPAQGYTETEMLAHMKQLASQNRILKSYIGKGYTGTITPPVIIRNVLECPEWYTSYTPYQPEISQGRLEALLNYQTVVADLTGLPIANASLLDEGSAAAEAMIMSFHALRGKKKVYFVDSKLHPQTIDVVKSRASVLDISVVVVDATSPEGFQTISDRASESCGLLVQYPATDGSLSDLTELSQVIHAQKGVFSVASDLLALTLLRPPSEFGADIVLGSAQRFGVPMGYGGPHAAFFAVSTKFNRKMPGRLIGVSKDRLGDPALRLALQTREQHIKREKATSNICTAQALLANMAGAYAVYHGPEGLKNIARKVHAQTTLLASGLAASESFDVVNKTWFDTLTIKLRNGSSDELIAKAVEQYGINLFRVDGSTVSVTLDETVSQADLETLFELFGLGNAAELATKESLFAIPESLVRETPFLTNPVFHKYHNETAMLRYLHELQSKDLSLANSMIPLGSCTMKLNATVEMMPITWPEFSNLHPFVPKDQAAGYAKLIAELEKDLADITGFDATSLMPNSGAQGEYTGLRAIRAYLDSQGETARNVCLIPVSAHGTNPASAAMAGMKVVAVKCLENGSLDLEDLAAKADKFKDQLAAVMITYPSTYGLFEPGVRTAIDIVHSHGGQVYLDGANMNAQVGLTSPGDLGADVCHLNLHKTFCIPHGGGGPGVGPICVKKHLAPFLPSHSLVAVNGEQAIEAVCSAPYGSASILPISYSYIKMMGSDNLPYSSVLAMLSANYMVKRLQDYYPIMFIGKDGIKHCGHEFILDLRGFHNTQAIDVAKRLQDYSFHAPTMSFPVANTLMIEPTESEDLTEIDRFIDSMISIRKEIELLEKGEKAGNVLKNAPHNLKDLLAGEDVWAERGYTRETAAYPLPVLKNRKFWPHVARVDDTYGDLNLMCTCPSVEELAEAEDA